MKVRIPYSRVSVPHNSSFMKFKNSPNLKVGLYVQPGRIVKTELMIDTGSQMCLLDNAYAKYLGIKDYRVVKDSEHKVHIYGVGGRKSYNTAYFHDVHLVVFKDNKNLKLKNTLKDIEIKLGFLEKPIIFTGVLGVYGFLDHFSFTVNLPGGYFEIEDVM